MQTLENGAAQRRQDLDVISVKRNPYLVDYEEQRRLRKAANGAGGRYGRVVERRSRGLPAMEEERRRRTSTATGRTTRRTAQTASRRTYRSVDMIDISRGQPRALPAGRRKNSMPSGKAVRKRRRRRALCRKLMAGAWILCVFMIGWLILVKRGMASEGEQGGGVQEFPEIQEETINISCADTQGLAAEVFAGHPAWTEDFLSVSEYSRSGETLSQVRDIFVHYTANPGTSAAQNRSYFEQQKDMHEASVSAHFIIGYEGEIIQCVPLNEIAYAVQTRNYDSISIECCYKAEDGSFTQETYNSLIDLLTWLTDAYDLDTEHILRHYDCGGKKCPLYYTEHEDAWARLKKDVEEKRSLSAGNQ